MKLCYISMHVLARTFHFLFEPLQEKWTFQPTDKRLYLQKFSIMSLGQLILVQVILKRFRQPPSSFVFTLMPIETNVEEPKNRSLIRLSALMARLSNKKRRSKQWMQFVLEYQDTLQCLIAWSNWTGCANFSANRPEKSVLHTQFHTEKRLNATVLEEYWAIYVKQTVPKFTTLAVALDIRL